MLCYHMASYGMTRHWIEMDWTYMDDDPDVIKCTIDTVYRFNYFYLLIEYRE